MDDNTAAVLILLIIVVGIVAYKFAEAWAIRRGGDDE